MRRRVKQTPKRTPRTRKPKEMSLEEWQIALRREYAVEQRFDFKNLGKEPIFSEFAVTNPASGRTYRVAVRGMELGTNFCSCPDFAVNTLGTCKHIEWLLAKLHRKRGAKAAFKKGFRPPFSEVFLQYGARRRVRFQAGSEFPPPMRPLAERFFGCEGDFREETAFEFEKFVRAASASEHEIRIYDDALDFIARLRDDENRRSRIDKEFRSNGSIRGFDKLLKVELYPYQQRGALFAAKVGRCLLADDMGLGKTIQSIAAVEILAKTVGADRVLVVCPSALKHQWLEEILRFTDRTAAVVEGSYVTRRDLYREDHSYKIVNYEIVHRDLDPISRWNPDVVILDEAQRIKNWETRRAQTIKKISSNYAIVLTGTPLENRLAELHSIMEFVDRDRLGPLFRFLSNHQETDEAGKVVGYRNLHRIQETLSPVLLRRRKKEVLQELPERTDKHYFFEMTDQQRAIHEENREIVAHIVAKWRRKGFLTEQEKRKLMIALQYMRMAANSTYLIDKVTDHGPKMDECAILLDDILEFEENKVVIFSQWLGTHELLIRRLEGEKRPYSYYNGSLDNKQRKQAIEQFKKDPGCRILLCTDSGGVGLNLQMASVVINMDQPWNPAVLEQRVGRVHRLGQHRHVQVHHFISKGSIEHGMLGVLKFKSAMFEGVLDGGESNVFLGDVKMKRFMETVEKVSESIPVRESTPDVDGDVSLSTDPSTEEMESQAPSPVPQQQIWSELISAGIEFLGKLGQVMQAEPSKPNVAALPLANILARMEQTGAPELRFSLPDEATAEKFGELLTGFGQLLKDLGKRNV
ncbi:MAG: RNA polymerase-associated protein RapA [bacterium]|nr:RNA polymerase-associated protein RapA [bacterium]